MLNDLIRERLSEMIQKAARDLLDQAKAMKPIITRGSLFEDALYYEYTAYRWPHMHDGANTVEGSLVQPITDEGRLLE
jgi:hypothetical protein